MTLATILEKAHPCWSINDLVIKLCSTFAFWIFKVFFIVHYIKSTTVGVEIKGLCCFVFHNISSDKSLL